MASGWYARLLGISESCRGSVHWVEEEVRELKQSWEEDRGGVE